VGEQGIPKIRTVGPVEIKPILEKPVKTFFGRLWEF
jgi:hypothetical protein